MRILLPALVILFLFSGCQNYDAFYSRPMLARIPYTPAENGPTQKAILPRDYICDLPGGTRMGGNRVTALAGEYVVYGSDNEGVFWRHSTKGIIRSGNLGKIEAGGIYCPHDPAKRCLLWIIPRDQGPLYLGAVVIIPDKARPEIYTIYVGDVPNVYSEEVRSYFLGAK